MMMGSSDTVSSLRGKVVTPSVEVESIATHPDNVCYLCCADQFPPVWKPGIYGIHVLKRTQPGFGAALGFLALSECKFAVAYTLKSAEQIMARMFWTKRSPGISVHNSHKYESAPIFKKMTLHMSLLFKSVPAGARLDGVTSWDFPGIVSVETISQREETSVHLRQVRVEKESMAQLLLSEINNNRVVIDSVSPLTNFSGGC